MGKLKSGINGPVSGRSGNTVYYELNGENVFRAIGENNSNTLPQQKARIAFGMITSFLTSLSGYIKIGFKNVPVKTWNYHNYALSVNKTGAIKGSLPNQEIDYEKVKLSIGVIPAPKNPKVMITNNRIEFCWDADMETDGTSKRDQVMLAAYFPESGKSICLCSGARRSVETESIPLPSFKGKMIIETYMSFISDDRKTVSNSIYTGQLIWNNIL